MTAKKFLSQYKIHYNEKDVNTDAEAASELMSKGIMAVPTFKIGDEMVVGFDQAKILQLVDHRVIQCEQCQANLRVPTDKGTIKVTCPKCQHAFEVTPQ